MNKQWYIKLRKLLKNPRTRKILIKEVKKLRKKDETHSIDNSKME